MFNQVYKYHFQLHDRSGKLIADWYMTSYGKTPTAFAQSDSAGLNLAIQMAMRDTGANLILGFARVPEIQQWLVEQERQGKLQLASAEAEI